MELPTYEVHVYSIYLRMYVSAGQFRGQKGLSPLEKSLEMPQYLFSRKKKK
jgi:hypothetical protein